MDDAKLKIEGRDVYRLQQDLDELEWYLDEFSTFLPLAVCTLSHLGIVVSINKSFEKLTGYDSIAMIREPLEKIFLPPLAFNEMLEKARANEVLQSELSLKCQNGQQITAAVSIGVRKDQGGNLIGFYVALTDITELKKLQNELEQKVAERTQELQEKLADLEKFAKLTIGRELKMVELKNRIKELENDDSTPPAPAPPRPSV